MQFSRPRASSTCTNSFLTGLYRRFRKSKAVQLMTQPQTSHSSTLTTSIRPRSEPATREHAEDLALRLSFLDQREITIYTPGATSRGELIKGIELSADCRTLIGEDGRPLAMWGVVGMCGEGGVWYGAPWLLSAASEKYSPAARVRLIKECKKSIRSWHDTWRRLEGFSWAKAVEHHKLLKLLGFELSPVINRNGLGQKLNAPTIMFARHLDYIEKGESYYVRD